MQKGLLQGVNAARVGESCWCESLAGATGVFGVKSVMFDVCKVLNLPDICSCMCCTPPPPKTILECQSACLYPLNKSDFLSEICSVSFKNK